MPLLSLVPPSPWSVFPLFLWRGCWHLPPPCLLLPHLLQVLLWSRVKIHWSAQRPPGKGRDPKNYSEYIFLLSLHEQQDGAREICHETVLNVLGGRTCSPHGLSAQWGVFAHPDLAVAVGTSTCLPAWELAAISMILVPHPDPKIPQKIYFN